MTLRRPSWSSSSPLISRLAAVRVGPPRQWRKSGDVERTASSRRNFASLSPAHDHAHSELLLQNLLAALQRKDVPGTSSAFFQWVENLEEPSTRSSYEDQGRLAHVSGPVLSEILRGMDPVRRPELDVAYGLAFSQGSLGSTDAGKLVDEFGVRRHHRRAAEGVQKLMRLRAGSLTPLQPADFDAILRIVGASVDYALPPVILDWRKQLGGINWGTAANWVEFLKARFMTDPVYYQYSRSNVVLSARQRVDHDTVRTAPGMVRELDAVRYSMNHFARQPWNRRRDRPEDDVRRLLRRSGEKFSGYLGHWVRMHALGVDVDVEFLSVSVEAFARSGSRQQILDLVLRKYYGIVVNEDKGTITGGYKLARDSAIYPTPRLQQAIVEAFGAMGDISLAMQLVDFISQRYGVRIPAEIWSNLLSWTYVCASKGTASFRRKWSSPSKSMPDIRVGDVLHVWKLMTSPPYNIEPSFQDLSIYIRASIVAHRFDDAIPAIQKRAVPFYDLASRELEEAMADEIMLGDFVREHYDYNPSNVDSPVDASVVPPTTASALSAARRRRQQAEVHKDLVTHHINLCLSDLLKESSGSRRARTSSLMTVTVPDLLRSLPHFFLHGAHYRTATGRVSILPPASTPRFDFPRTEERDALRTRVGAAQVHALDADAYGNRRMVRLEGSAAAAAGDGEAGDNEGGPRWVMNPDFVWPETRDMRIKGVRRPPRQRPDVMGVPPPEGGSDGRRSVTWWKQVEDQLAM